MFSVRSRKIRREPKINTGRSYHLDKLTLTQNKANAFRSQL